MSRLYTTPLAIGPNRHPTDQIRDAEAFCRRYLDQAFDDWGHFQRPDDYDDSLALLIAHLWRLSVTFDTERNDCFANYARAIIPKRAADVGPRRLLGRNGNRLHTYQYEQLDETTPNSRPGETLPDITSHTDPHRPEDARRAQHERNRQNAWAAGVLGLRTPPIAA